MEKEQLVTNLINALNNQEFTFSEKLYSDAFVETYDYKSGIKKKFCKTLQFINNHIVSYDHIDKTAFENDFNRFQQFVDDRMLFCWGYKSGYLAIVGIIFADNLSEAEIKALFSRLDDGVTNIMRKHTAKVSGRNNGATYGTMMLIFSDSNKANAFNSNIKKYFKCHFFKCTYISAISIDCTTQTLVQGKAALGLRWQGCMDISVLKTQLFI